jgi:phospholipid/cholesterol/gamma-HCH transport system substrate-binding protein
MAAAKKVSWAQLRVGVMALVAMAILAVLIFLLTGSKSLFQKNVPLHTFLKDSAAMSKGAPVRLNGILIGSVDEVRLSGSADPNRIVEIDMSVQEKFLPQIPTDSLAAISAANLLGDKFINISKGTAPDHVRPGSELRAAQGQDIPELITQSGVLLEDFQRILGRVDSLLGGIEKGQGNIGLFLKDEELYNRLTATAAEGQRLIADIRNGKGTMSRLIYDDALYNEIRAPIKRIDDLLADLQNGNGTAGKLLKDPALYQDAQHSIAELRRMIEDVNAGKGTAGKLLKDEQLYRQFNQLMAKIDTTIDKVNSGQGTLGQLMVNPQLYESMNGATREAQALLKDIRANPRRFLRIKLAVF